MNVATLLFDVETAVQRNLFPYRMKVTWVSREGLDTHTEFGCARASTSGPQARRDVPLLSHYHVSQYVTLRHLLAL